MSEAEKIGNLIERYGIGTVALVGILILGYLLFRWLNKTADTEAIRAKAEADAEAMRAKANTEADKTKDEKETALVEVLKIFAVNQSDFQKANTEILAALKGVTVSLTTGNADLKTTAELTAKVKQGVDAHAELLAKITEMTANSNITVDKILAAVTSTNDVLTQYQQAAAQRFAEEMGLLQQLKNELNYFSNAAKTETPQPGESSGLPVEVQAGSPV